MCSIMIDILVTFECRLLNPAVSRLDKLREKRIKKALIKDQFEPVEVKWTIKIWSLRLLMYVFTQGTSNTNPVLDGEFSDSEKKGRKRTISVNP